MNGVDAKLNGTDFAYEYLGCLHDMFSRQAKSTPDATVVVAPPSKEDPENVSNSRKLTLGKLDESTDLLASYLREKCGVKPDEAVGIYMDKCLEYVISYAAILKAGGAYMPLDVSYPEPLLKSIIDESQPRAVCTKPEFAHVFANTNVAVLIFDDDWEENVRLALNGTVTKAAEKTTLDNMAYLVYSSGTTGKPKGIRCPHRGAVFSYHWRHVAYPFQPDDKVACNVFFVWEMFRPILKGIPMYIIPDDVIYDPVLLCQFLKRHGITRILFTPSLFETILSTQTPSVIEESFRTMRIIWLCGEVVTITLLQRAVQLLPRVQILNLYSISECHDVTAIDLSDWFKKYERQLNDAKTARKFAPVGKLLPLVSAVIMDEHFQPQPIGVSGEIYVGGPALALGYLNRPEINEAKFLNTPKALVGKLGLRLYRTGDWGYLLADGSLEICGRCDTMVKVRGYSVEIQAIEAALLNVDGVSACVVVAKGQEGEDKYLVAYIVRSNKNVTRREIRAALKGRLPFYMIPSYFVILPQLPLLPASSKVDKRALPAVDRIRDVIEPEALAKTPTEIALAKLWAEVLGLTSVDVHDSFFDLGGHSLLATKLLNHLKLDFDVNLSVRDLFAEPTVAGLARLLDGMVRNEAEVSSPSPAVDLRLDVESLDLKNTVMDLYLRAFWRSLRWDDRWKQGCVLLTGATGFLGSFLLKNILLKTKLRVVCIVRESPEATVETRISDALKQICALNDTIWQEFKSRVIIFKGDVALTFMGLNEDDYQFLTYDIDFVIHAAAYVNLIYPYSALRGANVLGTQNILSFCYANKIKPLHYISTDAVFPNGLQSCEEETKIDDLWPQLSDGYSQSKWVAEQLVLRARQRGLPTIIYRLGNQSGDSTTGVWNPQDFTYLMLYGCAAVSAVPEIQWQVEMTPVDFTVDIILQLATSQFTKNVGKIFHLINVKAPTFQDVCEWLQHQNNDYIGYDFERLSLAAWLDRLRGHINLVSSNDSTLRLLERFLDVAVKDDSYFSALSTFHRTNIDAFLSEMGVQYPVTDEKYVQDCVVNLIDRHRFPKPKRAPTKPLANKVCIITGASSGIGEAIAKLLAEEGGAKVGLLARRIDKLENLRHGIEKNGGHAIAVSCDITDPRRVHEAVQKVEATFSRTVDILINNAGVMHYTLMKNLRVDEWQQEIDVNCTGTMNVLAACLKSMVERRSGHIINITSDAGRRAFPGLAVYSGTKFFLEGMSNALRHEMTEYNIRVTNIQPGDVATELLAHSTDAEALSQLGIGDTSKNADILQPMDVARAVFYAVTAPAHCAVNEILIEPQQSPI